MHKTKHAQQPRFRAPGGAVRRLRRHRVVVFGATALAVGIFGLATHAHAAECWQVTGWSSSYTYGAQATVEIADCTTIPESRGWATINRAYDEEPDDDLYLRVNLGDDRVSNWSFNAWLMFAGYDNDGKPVIMTDGLVCLGCTNTTPLSSFPPEQGVPTAGSRVRLRHRETGRCMYGSNSDGSAVDNATCGTDPKMTFVLDNAGGGKFRLRNEPTGQCLYTWGDDGGTMNHWGCWEDPAMAFALDPGFYGYRLRSPSWQCAYNYYSSSYHWGCWASSDLDYYVDIIEYGNEVDGRWTLSGGRSYSAAANPRYRLSLAEAGSIQIDLGSNIDTYLYLLDANGNLMYANDDSGPGYDSRLNVALGMGDYTLVAATYSTHQIGDFQISANGGKLMALAESSWVSSGGRSTASTANPRYELELNDQSVVELNLMSSVDTYLYLLNENGDLLYSNDDGGDGYNSRLQLDLGAGRYVIVAATYSPGGSGSFDITSSHGTLRSATTSFSMVAGDGAQYCPSGYFLSSRAAVTTNRPLAEAQLPTWHIARITDSWALRGSGYSYTFAIYNNSVGYTLCGAR